MIPLPIIMDKQFHNIDNLNLDLKTGSKRPEN